MATYIMSYASDYEIYKNLEKDEFPKQKIYIIYFSGQNPDAIKKKLSELKNLKLISDGTSEEIKKSARIEDNDTIVFIGKNEKILKLYNNFPIKSKQHFADYKEALKKCEKIQKMGKSTSTQNPQPAKPDSQKTDPQKPEPQKPNNSKEEKSYEEARTEFLLALKNRFVSHLRSYAKETFSTKDCFQLIRLFVMIPPCPNTNNVDRCQWFEEQKRKIIDSLNITNGKDKMDNIDIRNFIKLRKEAIFYYSIIDFLFDKDPCS